RVARDRRLCRVPRRRHRPHPGRPLPSQASRGRENRAREDTGPLYRVAYRHRRRHSALLHGNLILALWLVWSVGSFAGGLAGGVLLEKLGATSGKMQKSVLRLAYLVAIAGALLPFLNWAGGKG